MRLDFFRSHHVEIESQLLNDCLFILDQYFPEIKPKIV